MSQYGKPPLGYRNPGDDCTCQSDRDFGCRPDPFCTCQPASCGCSGGIPGPRGPRGATGPTGPTAAAKVTQPTPPKVQERPNTNKVFGRSLRPKQGEI